MFSLPQTAADALARLAGLLEQQSDGTAAVALPPTPAAAAHVPPATAAKMPKQLKRAEAPALQPAQVPTKKSRKSRNPQASVYTADELTARKTAGSARPRKSKHAGA